MFVSTALYQSTTVIKTVVFQVPTSGVDIWLNRFADAIYRPREGRVRSKHLIPDALHTVQRLL